MNDEGLSDWERLLVLLERLGENGGKNALASLDELYPQVAEPVDDIA